MTLSSLRPGTLLSFRCASVDALILNTTIFFLVMPAKAGIHVFFVRQKKNVDGRSKSGHDGQKGKRRHHLASA
jgi:hypothetical protein